MKQIGVLQVCDSLATGGMERVAVNLANALPQDRYRSHLCSTREEGQMAEFVQPHVGRICLHRCKRFDVAALRKFIGYIRDNEIQIIHAHGTSVFFSILASGFSPHPILIWHDHFGRYATEERPVWLYRLAAKRVDSVIAVNQSLANWAQERLHLPAVRVRYIPNFVCEPGEKEESPALPGQNGFRIVCVANFRPQKDHLNLLEAMRIILRQIPETHLLLLGNGTGTPCYEDVIEKISSNGLAGHISVMGLRKDVYAVLRACDIGVLSSSSEGLPLALLEYGFAGIAVVATQVGQCAEVLAGGRCGMLVRPRDPEQMAKAILSLLRSKKRRRELGSSLNERVHRSYSQEVVIRQVADVYKTALTRSERFVDPSEHRIW